MKTKITTGIVSVAAALLALAPGAQAADAGAEAPGYTTPGGATVRVNEDGFTCGELEEFKAGAWESMRIQLEFFQLGEGNWTGVRDSAREVQDWQHELEETGCNDPGSDDSDSDDSGGSCEDEEDEETDDSTARCNDDDDDVPPANMECAYAPTGAEHARCMLGIEA